MIDGDDNHFSDLIIGRSSSEEKESLTPAQSKRKAQNRAAYVGIFKSHQAIFLGSSPWKFHPPCFVDHTNRRINSQRAFRERKERHVKDLQAKVSTLEEASTILQVDNERLKRELAKYATENEILRATSRSLNASNSVSGEFSEPTITGPMEYTPTDFRSELVSHDDSSNSGPAQNDSQSPQHRITVCQITGERLLDASATWELIQSHELFKRGQVDLDDVANRLKKAAQCNGQGPAYKESDVRRAIEASAAECDELI